MMDYKLFPSRKCIADFQRKLQTKINAAVRICNTSAHTSSHVSLTDFGKEEEKGESHTFPNSRDLSRSSANPDRRALDGNINRMSMNSIILSY